MLLVVGKEGYADEHWFIRTVLNSRVPVDQLDMVVRASASWKDGVDQPLPTNNL